MVTASWNTFEWYSIAPLCVVAPVTVAVEYSKSALEGSLTCSSLSGNALYKIYVAGRRNLDVYKQNTNDNYFTC